MRFPSIVLPDELDQANKVFEEISGDKHKNRLFCQTMEECAELQVGILHLLRERSNPEEIMSEIADIVICVDSLIEMFGGYKKLNELLKTKSQKYLKQMLQIKNGKAKNGRGRKLTSVEKRTLKKLLAFGEPDTKKEG